jgi:osmotically-inducible protein OsmY
MDMTRLEEMTELGFGPADARPPRSPDMIKTAEITDTELKMRVLAQLQFEPSVQITDIGVLVKDGVVTLNGSAANYGEKLNAVLAAKRVAGVLAIADNIDVSLPAFAAHTDAEIAAAAVQRIIWTSMIPPGAVQVTVRSGQVLLEGAVEWGYQKHAATEAVQNLAGVKGIDNEITIRPALTPEGIDANLRAAIKRNGLLDESTIQVATTGRHVVLSGKVRSHAEWEEAARLAWAAGGVLSVDNQLKVEWFWDLVD